MQSVFIRGRYRSYFAIAPLPPFRQEARGIFFGASHLHSGTNTSSLQLPLSFTKPKSLRSSNKILLERTQELSLLLRSLVCTVTELGRSVDPLELDLLKCLAGCVREHGFSESDDSLLDTWDRALEENKVVLDLTVADEATHSIKRLAIRLL